MTKSQIAALVREGRVHECFTHSIMGTFDVTLMRERASAGAYERFTADLTPDLIAKIKSTRDWDVERVAELISAANIDDLIAPTLWIDTGEPTDNHILIDGTHRLIALSLFKIPQFRGYMIPLANAIRPDLERMVARPEHDWGRMEIRNGEFFDRVTGKKIP